MYYRALGVGFLVWLLSSFVTTSGSAQSHFTNCSQQTGHSATILIPEISTIAIDGSPVPHNSELAVFTDDNICAGVVVWSGESTAFSVWGDDPQTETTDGFSAGEALTYRLWDAGTGAEYSPDSDSITVTYGDAEAFYRIVNTYAENAIYVLESLTVHLHDSAPLSAPSITSPSAGAMNVAPPVNLAWTSVEHAESYDVHVSRTSNFSSLDVNRENVAGTSIEVDLTHDATQYFWRVRAVNSDGPGPWSSVRSFVSAPPLPGAVNLISPENGARSANLAATFSWSPSAYAQHYQLEIATSESFEDLILSFDELSQTEYSAAGFEAGLSYYWRVRGMNHTGYGEWSSTFQISFEPQSTPGLQAPGLLSPADGANDQIRSINLSWQTVVNAQIYHVQISMHNDFRTRAVDANNVTATSLAVSQLTLGEVYFWRVRAINADTTSAWSSTWQFATGTTLPDKVALLSPQDGVTASDTVATFIWSSADRAEHYQLQVADSPTFDGPTISIGELHGTQYYADGFEPGHVYFWRVRGVSSSGPGEWSIPFELRTPRRLRLRPVLESPANGSTLEGRSASFIWNSEAETREFLFQLATDEEFLNVIQARDKLTVPEVVIDDLTSNAVYHWRVAAVGLDGRVEWSEPSSFSVPQEPPSTRPSVSAPLNNDVVVGEVVTLEWQPVDHATNYRVQLYEAGSDGLVLVVDSSGIGEERVSVRLTASNEYAWQVQAFNEAGLSPWSNISKFTASVTTDAKRHDVPHAFALHPNYPNPFNPSTTMRFDLPVSVDVSVHIYDAVGSLVDVLLSNERLPAGRHTVSWNALNLPSGTYFCQVRADEMIRVQTLSLLK